MNNKFHSTCFQGHVRAGWRYVLLLIVAVLTASEARALSVGDYFSLEYEGTTLRYKVLSNSTCEVSGYVTGQTDVKIPSQAEGYSVVSIGAMAFKYNSSMTSVTLPESVTSIRGGAFDSCSGLASVTISESVTSIGDYAFKNCTKLTSITIPESVTLIEHNAFEGCSGLTSITIGTNVTSIGNQAFYGCSGIKTIICNALTPPSANANVFSNYEGVTLTVPAESVEEYKSTEPWSRFSILPSTPPPSPGEEFSFTYVGSTLMYKVIDESTCMVIGYVGGIKELIIPPKANEHSVLAIGDNAFRYCSGLTSITIPEGVTSIGERAFEYCSGVNTLTLPKSLSKVGYAAFVKPIKNVYIPSLEAWCNIDFSESSNPISGGENLYINGESVTDIVIPESIKEIKPFAFTKCSVLTSVTLPVSVASIGEWAFSGCTGLTSLTIPKSLTSIGTYAFSNCTNLTTIICNAVNPPTAEETTFSNYEGVTLIVPEESVEAYKVTDPWSRLSIEAGFTFTYEGSTLKYKKLDENTCEVIGYEGESTDFIIPAQAKGLAVVSIGSSAFAECSRLTSLTIPASVTSIGSQAFAGCTAIKTITCNAATPPTADKTSFGKYVGVKLLIPTQSVESYKATLPWSLFFLVPGDEFSYTYKDATFQDAIFKYKIITDNTCELIGYEGRANSVIIPENVYELSVVSVGASAFKYCLIMTSVTIPVSVTSIGASAFSGCRHLTSVTIPESVTFIGDSAFSGCTSLSSIDFPQNITTIAKGICSGGTGLTSITIPESVTSIGEEAFAGCMSIATVTCNAVNPPTTAASAFDVYYSAKLIVPEQSEEQYKTTQPWSRFFDAFTFTKDDVTLKYKKIDDRTCEVFGYEGELTELTIPSRANELSVVSIGESAFSDCTGLTSLSIPYTVSSIGVNAFRNDSSLTSVSITHATNSIGAYAFANCTGLTTAIIPGLLTSIEDGVFYGCTGLTSITIPEGVTNIGNGAFYGCENVKTVTCNAINPPTADRFSFNKYIGVNLIVPAQSVEKYKTTDPWNVFFLQIGDVLVHSEEDATFSFKVISENSSALIGVNLKNYCNFAFPEKLYGLSLVEIENNVFRNNRYLCEIRLPESLTSIEPELFFGCSSLELVILPKSLTKIENGVFSQCSNLKSIEIPNSVTTIGDRAFRGCSGLKSATFGNSVTTIGDWAFSGCSRLNSVTFGNSVTTIGDWAFSGCSWLPSIEIPNSVTTISTGAFAKCGLMSIEIPNSVTTISESAFKDCSELMSIEIPNSVTTIGISTFSGCSRLTSVTFGNSVTSIGDWAFKGCNNIISVRCYALTPPETTSRAFSTYANVTLSVPEERVGIYKATNPWWYFYIEGISGLDVAEADDVEISVEGGNIVIKGCEAAEVYNLAGVHVASVGAEGFVSGLPHGIYLVRVGTKTVKVAL